jgi:MHS family proline/betaine transporter-like MFS transporter
VDAPLSRKVMAAGAIGNVLEWYDFAIYGYFAATIGRTFFPNQDPVAQLLAAFGIFAIGFVVRPLGGALLGHIGDQYGRRTALTVSVAAMAVPTFLMGLLPGYQSLGLMAPILLTALRVIQGLSVGGECTTSIVFMVERAPAGRRGLVGAVATASATCGMMLGSAVGALLSFLLPDGDLQAWGWRIPFLLGLLVGALGYFLRRTIQEAVPARLERRPPILEALQEHKLLMLRLIGLGALNSVGFFVVFVYIVTWLQRHGVEPARALSLNTISMAAQVLTMFAMAWLSDRVGRRPMQFFATSATIVTALPLFWLMHHDNAVYILAGQFGFVVLLGMAWGVLPAVLVEATPPGVRCTVVALGFNITMGVIGGITPLAATWLVARTHQDLSPAWLIMAAAAVSFASMLTFKESYRSKVSIA